jgi:hypothetical protein
MVRADTTSLSILDRRALLGGLSLAILCSERARSSCAPARVLFVCRYGTVKSPIAREQLLRRARQRHIAVAVMARGLTPTDHLTPAVLAAARADGLDPRAQPVMRLSSADLAWPDIVVSFEPPAEAALPGARDWSDTPSFSDYPAARRSLMVRIDALLDEIARSGC